MIAIMGEKAGRHISQNDLEMIITAIRMKLKDSIKKLGVNLKNDWKPEEGKVDIVKMSICKYGKLYNSLNNILKRTEWKEYDLDFDHEEADKYVKEFMSKEFSHIKNKYIINYIKG